MIEPWIRYEDLEEKRDGYYVKYSPVFTGHEFAILKLNVYDSKVADDIKNIAESELAYWALKYHTPIMLMVSNMTDENWNTKDKIGHNYLLGYVKSGKVVTYWDKYPESEEPEFDLSKDYLSEVYAGLKYKTYEDVVAEQKIEAKGRKVFLIVLTLWACMIPALIAFFGWSNPVVSLLALAYSWYVAFQKGLKLWGRKKKSERELAEDKERLEKEHHHYHCKLNPEAFLRLRTENFKRQRLEKQRAKIESMRN
ncbi:hypothetical protein SAMN05216571_10748 [Onishia taeanensis]|uniref:Uncharacterized protein n=1 Tax=Onishia taeanensis TaxID=284577 RepID=A0A1G7SNB6_9GAMM|nr:hypothetical protein [Halomonas taeanensis]SDG24566.1 hypothetical protein SAMN05216571_10748 [Halomonas taeanensis]